MTGLLLVALVWAVLIVFAFGLGHACGRADEIRDEHGPRHTSGGWRL